MTSALCETNRVGKLWHELARLFFARGYQIGVPSENAFYLVGKLSLDDLQRWNGLYPLWYKNATNLGLESIIQDYISSPDRSAVSAWMWLANAPSLTSHSSFLLERLIDGIILNTGGRWQDESTKYWLQILKESARSAPLAIRLRLCLQALRYCFANTQLPLGAIVSEVFSDVYSAITNPSSTLADVFNFFNFLDWDKGKQLRRGSNRPLSAL